MDLIGKTIIDSEGRIYPSNSALALSDKPTIGTYTKRFYGIYSNRFELDKDGNLKVFGKTILGDSSADTVKFGGGIDSDILPYSNDNNVLGNSSYAFKSAQITTVNSSTINTTIITASGNVGIGTTGPNEKFQINLRTDENFLVAGHNSFSSGVILKAANDAYSALVPMELRASLFDFTGGNVGIGFTSPSASLHVVNTAAQDSFRVDDEANDSSPFVIDSGGNVGIGTTSPARSLHTTGSIRMGALITGGGSAVAVYRDANGDLADETSSIKFKTDITPYESVLSKVMDLEAVRFKWNDLTPTPGALDFGMIAENVNTILPDLVIYNDDGTPRGLRYEKMGLVALKAIQELNTQFSVINSQVSIDPSSGTVIIPYVQADQIALTSNLGNVSLSYDGSNIVYSGGEVSNQLLSVSSPAFVNLANKIDNLESRVQDISEQIASLSAQVATSSGELNLTPPDVLLATRSATLANLTVTSEATFSGQLLAYEATIQSTFKSLGQAFLGNTSIAGDLNVDGGLSITGDSISNLGVLYIQNSLLAQEVDLFNGKVTIDNQGKLSIQKLEVSSKTLGTVTIPAGQLELVVSSDQLTNQSKVFATPDKPAVLGVSKDVINSNFTIKLDQALGADLKVDWWIVDQAEN